MFNDLKFSFRQLRKSPGFTAIVVLTLALGIGANSAIFSIINTTFLRALPFPEPDRIMQVAERSRNGNDLSISYPNFLDWQKQQDVFAALAIYRIDGQKLQIPDSAERVNVALVSGEFLAALGVHAAQGRDLTPGDDRVGAPPVAWLTHAAWQRYFAGAPNWVGRTVLLDGRAVTVAGILPERFRFPQSFDLLMPLAPYAEQLFMLKREVRNSRAAIGRLQPGVTVAIARARMETIARRLEQDYPQPNTGIGINVTPWREQITGRTRTNLLLLWGAVGMVLMIACVNVANMLLARSCAREREMAIRISLGATRGDLLRQLLVESLVLAGAGGLLGVLVGAWGYEFAYDLVPGEVRGIMADNGSLDLRVLLFAVGLSVATGVVFGLAPAWRLSHTNPIAALKNAKASTRTVFGRFRTSDGLVVVQVALALMLLIGAGLLVRSMEHLLHVPSGIQPEQVLTLRISTPPMGQYLRDPSGFVTFHERILEQVRVLPGVAQASFGSSLPFTSRASSMALFRTDRPVPKPDAFPQCNSHSVTPGYFQTLGNPLLRGRDFDGHEPQPAIPAGLAITPATLAKMYDGIEIHCLISQRMAEELWPGEDAVGKQFQLGYPNMGLPKARVIGIVGNTAQQGLDRRAPAEFYATLRQSPAEANLHLVVRTKSDPAAMVAAVRQAIAAVAPDEPVFDVSLMTTRIAHTISNRRFTMGLFAAFAGVALVLVAVGIYGVLAFAVSQRTREVGIRMALGAQRRTVLCSILWRGFVLVLPGAAIGVTAAWLGSRLLQSQLFGVSSADPLTYVVGLTLLLLVAFAACFVPARRATRINPIEALRSE